MIVSGIKQKDSLQLTLFESERKLKSHGQARYEVGQFIEELACLFIQGAQRHRTIGNCEYCPDVSAQVAGIRVYFECKAVGSTREAFIYEGRLRKDQQFAASHSLYYCIWHHRSKPGMYKSIEDMQAILISKLHSMYLVPFEAILEVCNKITPVKLNSKYYGSSESPLYGSGYRFLLNTIEQYRLLTFEMSGD